jgi:hypothetical protein
MGMQNFKPGSDVPVTFVMSDEAGNVLTPTQLRWRVLDETETVTQDWTAITPLPSVSDVVVTVPASLTILTAPALRGIRTVELEITTSSGATVFMSEVIMLQGVTALSFGINTFQTYSQALLLTEDMIDEHVAGWSPSSRETREKALIESYKRIMQLPIGMHFDDQQSMLQIDTQFLQNYGPLMLRYMTPAQMLGIYKPMMKALQLAQATEATEILNGDPVMAARKAGILSQTVGESSQFFRPYKPLELAVSTRTINILQRWVRFNMKIGHAA